MQWKNSGLPINKNFKAVPLAGNVVFIFEGVLKVYCLSVFKSLLKPSVPPSNCAVLRTLWGSVYRK